MILQDCSSLPFGRCRTRFAFFDPWLRLAKLQGEAGGQDGLS